jgi:transposase
MKTILAAPDLLKIEIISFCSNEVRLVVKTRLLKSTCPSCGWLSDKAHSRYQRHLADLPWEGVAVKLILSARKFFCLNPDCRRQIFCERLPGLAAPYAHKTLRLNELLTRLGAALGGRPGARMALGIGIKIGRDALLARVRCAETAQSNVVRVLGVDDFAFRKGRSYGTILVDQQKHQIVDLLPDREASSLAAWLKNHPEIEIVTRDRGQAYADGIRQGAPQSVQIADRFHLMQNLTDALKRLVIRKSRKLQQALDEPARADQRPEPEAGDQHLQAETGRQSQQDLNSAASRERRYQLYSKVKELAARGLTTNQIAGRLRIHWLTAQRYAEAEGFPERAKRQGDRSPIDIYLPQVRRRWEEGCHRFEDLFTEIKAQGYSGKGYGLRRVLAVWRTEFEREQGRADKPLPKYARVSKAATLQNIPRAAYGLESSAVIGPPQPAPSPRRVAWIISRPAEELSDEDRLYLGRLFELSPEIEQAQSLTQRFIGLMRERKSEEFDAWLGEAGHSDVAEMKAFAKGLKQDYAAVKAGLTYEWSNGQVEGQINRLKTLKRAMFGRANLDLLKARVLKAA